MSVVLERGEFPFADHVCGVLFWCLLYVNQLQKRTGVRDWSIAPKREDRGCFSDMSLLGRQLWDQLFGL
jgi:hypothetical protein